MIVKMGHVEETNFDPAGALRIKARAHEDGGDEVPWAFPLLPKQFQVVPKIGEGVFLIEENGKGSNRYYIGPIISQPQFNEKCNFSYGRGQALSVLNGAMVGPLPNIKNDSRTEGSFPEIGSVSVVGRETQDIILDKAKNDGSDQVLIRCGVRKNDALSEIAAKRDGVITNVGKVIFNDIDPAYIQLKYRNNLANKIENYSAEMGEKVETYSKTNSAINIVADKINLVGVGDETINLNKANKNDMLSDSDMEKLMSELHQLPKGDILVKLLKLLRDALLTHTHNYNGLPPTVSNYVLSLTKFDLNDILSEYVRIS